MEEAPSSPEMEAEALEATPEPHRSSVASGSSGQGHVRKSYTDEQEGEDAGPPMAPPATQTMSEPYQRDIEIGPEDEDLPPFDAKMPPCDCAEMLGECECTTPPGEEEAKPAKTEIEVEANQEQYQLDEFMRAKNYFLQASPKSGLNLYDHLSDVIRKFLDDRAPNNPVDYLEEVSLNIKRYRFGIKKDDPLKDAFYISDAVLQDAKRILGYYKNFARWNEDKKEMDGESGMFVGGSFQNLLRLQYYLEQVNIGLPREEMFMLAISIKELSASRAQIGRLRFWGKIFGTNQNYYVVEAEFKFGGTDQAADLWVPKDEDSVVAKPQEAADNPEGAKAYNAVQTFDRAKGVVLDREFLTHYSKTSGLPPEEQAKMLPKPTSYRMPGLTEGSEAEWAGEGGEAEEMVEFEDPEAREEAMKWESYQQELMDSFPLPSESQTIEVPMEPDGTGVNRRVFYVTSNLSEDWVLLPPATPQQINASRSIRWLLTGDLNSKITTVPAFPGREGHYLKALITRITAGGMCSPKGFYKVRPAEGEMPGEDDDEDMEPEDEEAAPIGNDAVQPVKKYRASMKALTNPNLSFWVHHTAYILPQGRTVWWNPNTGKTKTRRAASDDGSELEDDEDFEDEDDEDEEVEIPGKETGPRLFQAISEDKAGDGKSPWSLVTSSTVFPEFQVVAVRSNTWPGSTCICTSKGKVSNVYFGDGLKFNPVTYCPPLCSLIQKEYKAGPELKEIADPSAEEEQAWLSKLELQGVADIEAPFVDNEEEGTAEEDEEETEYEY